MQTLPAHFIAVGPTEWLYGASEAQAHTFLTYQEADNIAFELEEFGVKSMPVQLGPKGKWALRIATVFTAKPIYTYISHR